MDEIQKKGAMLLKSLIFHYHGLDEDERALLTMAAQKLDAEKELEWANDFISQDYMSAFERSREFLLKVFNKMESAERIDHLHEVWEENHVKGYVTEMETTAIFTLSKDWHIEKEFLERVNH